MKNRIVRASDFNKRPAWLQVINSLWKASYPLGTATRLNKDHLIRTARKETGLKDLGPEFPEEALDRLLAAVSGEARLNPFGRFITFKRMVNLLSNRLRAEWWFKKHPEILEQELYPAILIAGLQRSGTTKLQRLLAADPETRPVLSWEAVNPAPPVADYPQKDQRIRAARLSEKALKIISPGFFAIHPVEHLAPEEDILLLDLSFMSTTAEATMYVPSYASWLEQTDQSAAYEYQVKLLKLLQWQRPGKRWVLKSPHHLEFMEEISRTFGQVHFLWTHREVYTCMASFLSMLAYGWSIFSDEVQIEQLTAHWIRKMGFMLKKGLKYRQSLLDRSTITDILYEDLVAHPMDILKQVYQESGAGSIRPGLEQRFLKTNEENRAGKYGEHRYDLSDFKLTPQDIDEHTMEYQQFMKKLPR